MTTTPTMKCTTQCAVTITATLIVMFILTFSAWWTGWVDITVHRPGDLMQANAEAFLPAVVKEAPAPPAPKHKKGK